jgi:nucleotide-binding universal stress UspA family protein
VLILHHDTRIAPPLIVAYDGSPAAQEALTLATQLAHGIGGFLMVLLVARTADARRQQKREIGRRMLQAELFVRTRPAAHDAETLAQIVRAEGGGMLVMHAHVLPTEEMYALLEQLDCPALLTR